MGNELEAQEPDGQSDISSILTGTSETETTSKPEVTSTDQGSGVTPEGYKFGGRNYKSQQEAEQAHNKLYGKFSEQQSLLNQLRGALKDPQKASALAKDPEWATILGKLGVQIAEQEQEAEEASAPQVPEGMEGFVKEWYVEKESLKLDREEWAFERKLGRALNQEERGAILDTIGRFPHFRLNWRISCLFTTSS